jgi:copper chaperone CopZ
VKLLLAAVLFASSAVVSAPSLLTPGKYEVRVDGMLCRTCARAIVEELGKLKEVQSVSADYDHEAFILTIAPNRSLKLARLIAVLGRAAERVDLGTRFTILGVKYRV